MTRRREIVLALGSNLGDRLANLQAGVDHLSAAPGLRVTAVSAVFETAPVGGPPQPDYLNAVLLADSELPRDPDPAARPGRRAGARSGARPRGGVRVRLMST